jgi:hypothetical protein
MGSKAFEKAWVEQRAWRVEDEMEKDAPLR